jgi:hypothetical protein
MKLEGEFAVGLRVGGWLGCRSEVVGKNIHAREASVQHVTA